MIVSMRGVRCLAGEGREADARGGAGDGNGAAGIEKRRETGACRDARKEAESGEGENDGQKKRTPAVLESFCVILVGATGFEPATPWSQTRCATKLRYAPLDVTKCILANKGIFVKYF